MAACFNPRFDVVVKIVSGYTLCNSNTILYNPFTPSDIAQKVISPFPLDCGPATGITSAQLTNGITIFTPQTATTVRIQPNCNCTTQSFEVFIVDSLTFRIGNSTQDVCNSGGIQKTLYFGTQTAGALISPLILYETPFTQPFTGYTYVRQTDGNNPIIQLNPLTGQIINGNLGNC